MSQTVPTQHPAVVLRSHYQHLRALLLIAMVGVLGLSGAVVILALDDDTTSGTTSASSADQIDHALRGSSTFEARPDESGVAAAIATPPAVARPDESKVAWAISAREATAPNTTGESSRPDESNVASAISGNTPSNEFNRPDESGIANAISGD